MQKTGPKAHTNQALTGSLGGFDDSFEKEVQQAAGQKQLASQTGSSQSQTLATGQGGGKAVQDFSGQQTAEQMAEQVAAGGGLPGLDGQPQGAPPAAPASPAAATKPPREIGTLKEELITRPLGDLKEEFKKFTDLNALMGINPQTDTPEEQARKRKMLQNYNQLTEDERQVAQRAYEEEMQQKEQEEKEKEEKERRQQEADQAQVVAPAGKKDGPSMPGGASRKKRAVTQLQQNRKQLGGAMGSN